jgi:hypothetical protein
VGAGKTELWMFVHPGCRQSAVGLPVWQPCICVHTVHVCVTWMHMQCTRPAGHQHHIGRCTLLRHVHPGCMCSALNHPGISITWAGALCACMCIQDTHTVHWACLASASLRQVHSMQRCVS